jgi:DCN1-like protein 1/2
MIAWRMKAATMCVFTREEWTRGLVDMGVDSIGALRSSFDELRQQLKDDDAFRDFYSFCFGFAKEPGYGVRTLPIEVANQMWQLTLADRLKHLKLWTTFLDEKEVKAVTKDVWDMLLTFANDLRLAMLLKAIEVDRASFEWLHSFGGPLLLVAIAAGFLMFWTRPLSRGAQ